MDLGRAYNMTIEEYRVHIIMPQNVGTYPIYYLHSAVDELEQVWSALQSKAVILVGIQMPSSKAWNDQLTPWKSKALMKNSEDFGGAAADYLKELTGYVIKLVEEEVCHEGYSIVERGLVGYSLGGLFAVYAGLLTPHFQQIASVSGSLWYDGFLDYVKGYKDLQPSHWYFSLGDKEAKTRNLRMAQVEAATMEISEYINDLMEQNLGQVIYEVNEGNHFKEVPKRIAKAVNWLVKQIE